MPVFCVSIAVLKDGVPIIGVVYDPNRDHLFRAVRRGSAYCGQTRLTARHVPLSAASLYGFSSRFVEGFPAHVTRLMRYLDEYRNLGSAVLHLCYAAHGWLDGAFAHSTRLWDIAAGGLILEEAGGHMTNFSMTPVFPLAEPISFYHDNYVPFVAAGTRDALEQLAPFFEQDGQPDQKTI